MPSFRVAVRRNPHGRYYCTWVRCLLCVGAFCMVAGLFLTAVQNIYLYPTCDDPSCWDFITSLHRSLNYSTSPCDNFYHFVCDGWKSSHGPNEFVFAELQAMVAHAAVNSLLRVGHAPLLRQTAVQKAAVMFKTCVQVFMNRADSTESLKSFLRSLDLLEPKPETVDVLDVIVGLGLDWNVPVILQMSVEHDQSRDGKPTLSFSRSRYLMEWFLRRSYMQGHALYNYVVSCSQLINHQFDPEALIFYENYIISSLGPTTETAFATSTVTLADLESHTPGILSSEWLEVINRHLPDAAQLTSLSMLRVADIRYLRAVGETILDDRRRRNGNLLLYVAWIVIQFLGPLASLSLIAPSFPTVTEAKNYIFYRCFEELNLLMPYAFGAPFAVDNVPAKAREDVLKMVKLVKKSLNDSFVNSKWMDNETRNIAVLKLHSMRTIIAYPDFVVNALDEYYAHVPDSSVVFLESRMRAWYVTMRKRKEKLWLPRAFDYDFRLTDVNAFYQTQSNTMIIPAGIINGPFYSPKYPASVNFGGLGHIIAHEIVHGFDDDSMRQPRGEESRDWWTMDTRAQYEQRVKCLKRMYIPLGLGAYERNSAMSEDIADSVGLAQALNAYRAVRRRPNATLRHDGPLASHFTSDQAFYVMSCFKWCSNRRATGRGYSADELRCNVPLKNIPDFARVFSCRRNDPMNPAHKCKLW
ncbi:neprilysin-1-like [Haemaphysalis longicornis]